MSDVLKTAARVKRVAIRLADASQCSNVRLTRQKERRAKKPFDPLQWLATNPINPEPSTREVQRV